MDESAALVLIGAALAAWAGIVNRQSRGRMRRALWFAFGIGMAALLLLAGIARAR
jgi:hypothetical protein